MSSTEVSICVFLAILSFVLWRFFDKEQKFNNFLADKLQTPTEEDKTNKSKHQILIEKELDSLDRPITYKQLMTISVVTALIITFVLYVILGLIGLIISAPVSFSIIRFLAPKFILTLLEDRRRQQFNKLLPVAINQLLAALQAGLTPVQGFKLLSEQPAPVGREFNRVYTDISTGASIEMALENLFTRNPSSDTKLLMTGLIVAQTATPAVAINTLKIITQTIQQRDSQKKSVLSAVAQGKATVILVSMLPVISFLGIEFVMPDYVNDFLATGSGMMLYGIAAVLTIAGSYIANRIISVSKIVDY